MGQISRIYARQILDSRGNPTIEVEVLTESGIIGRAAIPSGASKGEYEAVELRDNDKGIYLGKGVQKAVNNVNTSLNDELSGFMVTDQTGIDYTMIQLDGTDNKSNLGANAVLGVSLACARAAAQYTGQSLFRYIGGTNARTLPIPMMNILNGGQHADNKIDIQEFMIMPVGADTFSDALRIGVEVFHNLKSVLKEKHYSTNVGDEGGFAPDLNSNEEAIEVIIKAIEKAGYKPGCDVYLAIDAAASSFYIKKEKKYFLESISKKLTTEKMVEYYKNLIKNYPLISIEDGFAEDDWAGFAALTRAVGDNVQIVGDDLYVTNVKRLKRGIDEHTTNSILIKVNQIGTLTETINAVRLADVNSFTSIISHRSGETEDTTIADLSVALNTGQIKTGSASRTDRIAKYNQLLRIEELLGASAIYPGKSFKFLK